MIRIEIEYMNHETMPGYFVWDFEDYPTRFVYASEIVWC